MKASQGWCWLVCIVLVFLCLNSRDSMARNLFKTKEKTKCCKKHRAPNASKPRKELKHYKLNTLFGLQIFQGSSLVVGGQIGREISQGSLLYIGPEVSFSLDSPHSILFALVGGWYEIVFHRNPRFGISLGVSGGGAFSKGYTIIPSNTYAIFGDISVYQSIDPFVAVRGQFRPGTIGGKSIYMLNFNVSFRL